MKSKFIQILVLAGAATGVAAQEIAVAPAPGTNFDCTVLLGAFQPACNLNNDLADSSNAATGAYTGSCAGGGSCDDSVYNKLVAASNKVAAGKLTDACATLASIQASLLTWSVATKPKIDQLGYAGLSAEITSLQTAYVCQ